MIRVHHVLSRQCLFAPATAYLLSPGAPSDNVTIFRSPFLFRPIQQIGRDGFKPSGRSALRDAKASLHQLHIFLFFDLYRIASLLRPSFLSWYQGLESHDVPLFTSGRRPSVLKLSVFTDCIIPKNNTHVPRLPGFHKYISIPHILLSEAIPVSYKPFSCLYEIVWHVFCLTSHLITQFHH